MDNVLQIEILLGRINILLAKSIAFHDKKVMNGLEILRHRIYYGVAFDYDSMMNELMTISQKIKQWD